ncbi:hypothetical protein JXB41_05250 [Candidatus Woesearchaeota archaeon]|nr:hypothetical protein [Candidatus Woesearchaeota archaeon]
MRTTIAVISNYKDGTLEHLTGERERYIGLGYNAVQYRTDQESIDTLMQKDHALVLIDVGPENYESLLGQIKEYLSAEERVWIAYEHAQHVEKIKTCLRRGALDYVLMPFERSLDTFDLLKNKVRKAVEALGLSPDYFRK